MKFAMMPVWESRENGGTPPIKHVFFSVFVPYYCFIGDAYVMLLDVFLLDHQNSSAIE